MERRIARLEDAIVDAKTRALVEEIASEEGLDADELLAGVRRTMRDVGPDASIEELADYYAHRDGLTSGERDELIANTRKRMERYQR